MDRLSFAQPRSLCLNKQSGTHELLESALKGLPVKLFSHETGLSFNITVLSLSFLKNEKRQSDLNRGFCLFADLWVRIKDVPPGISKEHFFLLRRLLEAG